EPLYSTPFQRTASDWRRENPHKDRGNISGVAYPYLTVHKLNRESPVFYLLMRKMAIMTKIKELISNERLQYLIFIGLSIGAIGLTGILYFFNALVFQPYTGGINPFVAAAFVIVLGFISVSFLLSRGWFAIYKKGSLKGSSRFLGLAVLFASITVLIDFNVGHVGFPADMNVLFPKSLLFYPAMGFFAEILFHVVPLTILLISLTSILKKVSHKKIIWICFSIIPLVEVVYQVMPMSHFPLWAIVVFSLNLFLFELSQLLIFKKYDFVSMYSFRLAYYLVWHIVWGYLRLKILF
ncbi:hypothetical protein HYR54_06160, partial [Candidatus Acetothermia bacterium]|nr:hypothetical protein [Candidatus Acetothermia bacterium]